MARELLAGSTILAGDIYDLSGVFNDSRLSLQNLNRRSPRLYAQARPQQTSLPPPSRRRENIFMGGESVFAPQSPPGDQDGAACERFERRGCLELAGPFTPSLNARGTFNHGEHYTAAAGKRRGRFFC